jgi:hypothetical protein
MNTSNIILDLFQGTTLKRFTSENIQELIIEANIVSKYILCRKKEGSPDSYDIVVLNEESKQHESIYLNLGEKTSKVLGGGKIEFNPEKNTIIIFGSSAKYKWVDHGKTKNILSQYFKSWEIKADFNRNF